METQPSKVNSLPWVYFGKKPSETNDVGKWMLFYPVEKIDIKWKQFCELYSTEKLPGILSMKCSTAYKNPRSSNHNDSVIILYCNNSHDEEDIINIGKCILPYIHDYPSKAIYYKTDTQTREGTRATGKTVNSTYKLYIH